MCTYYKYQCPHCGRDFISSTRNRKFCSLKCSHLSRFTVPTSEHFWAFVDKSGGENSCWLWTGHLDHDGYGRCRFDGKWAGAHRVAWRLTYGEIPEELCVCHACDVRSCCNPKHLWLGSNADNTADMVAKKRNHFGENHHKAKLTWDDVRAIRYRFKHGILGKTLAKEYGVWPTNISMIVTGATWHE